MGGDVVEMRASKINGEEFKQEERHKKKKEEVGW